MACAKRTIFSGTWCVGLAWLFWIILIASLSVEASTAVPAVTESMILGERPSSNGEPTVIELAVLVFDIDEIDDVNQRFNIDLFVVARWHDPRLALPEAERHGKARFMMIDDVWTPKILLINDRGLTPQLREGVEVDDLGNMKYQNRLSGELKVNLEFQQFPFDVQRLPIDIVSYEYTVDEIQFSPGSVIVSQADKFSIEGWQLKPLEPVVGVFEVPGGKSKFPRLTYIIEAERDSDFYVLTMLVPMALIIFMAWTVFWLQPNIVPPRIAIATASIFSLIALGVSIRLGLPKVSYLTKADIFVLGCTLMVFAALGVAVIGSRWANSDRMEQASKLNAIARWVYMLLFVVVAFIAFSQ
jgi:hypothetical protein